MVLFVTEQGAEVGIRRERLEVRKGKRLLASERMEELEQVALCGVIHLSGHAIRALLRRGVDVVQLTLGGGYIGRFSGDGSRHIDLRWAQYERLREPAFALEMARRYVIGKIRNQRWLLQRRTERGLSNDNYFCRSATTIFAGRRSSPGQCPALRS